MQFLFCISAFIGSFVILATALILFLMLLENRKEIRRPKKLICGLTMENCERSNEGMEKSCDGCPLAEAAVHGVPENSENGMREINAEEAKKECADRETEKAQLLTVLREIAELSGFEIEGEMRLKDRNEARC